MRYCDLDSGFMNWACGDECIAVLRYSGIVISSVAGAAVQYRDK